MNKQFAYPKGLFSLIIIGFIFAIFISVERYNIEAENKTIDLAMDYEDVLLLAKRSGEKESDVLKKVKDAGITSLCVYDKTFKKLNASGMVMAVSGGEILSNYRTGKMLSHAWQGKVLDGTITEDKIYITGRDKELFEEVIEDLKRRLGKERLDILDIDGEKVVALREDYESFLKMDLGLARSEMQKVNDASFFVLPRPSNIHLAKSDDIKNVFERLEGIEVSEMVFSGKEILGYPQELATLQEKLKKINIPIGLIEHTTQLKFYPQKGLLETAKELDYKVARVYSIPKDEQPKMTIREAEERWSNTNLERNIRINLLRIYEKPSDNLSLLETNLTYIKSVRERLARDGFAFGRASVFPPFFVQMTYYLPMIFGVSAAVLLYVSLINSSFTAKKAYLWTVILAFGSILASFMFSIGLLRTIYAFLSANIFPALAMIFAMDFLKNHTLEDASLLKKSTLALCLLFATGIFSFFGAVYLSGFLTDTEYLLEMQVFRGVKLTFILPLILVALAFLERFSLFAEGGKELLGAKKQVQYFLQKKMTVSALLIFLCVTLTVVIFIGRSGHTMGVPVPSFELKFRAFLEEMLYARPRSKEIFLGHPAFVVMLVAFFQRWEKKLFFLFVLLATIGQGSMVETFAHMRTPIFISFVRGLEGISLGGVLGILIFIAVILWQTSLRNVGDRSADKGNG